MCRICPFFTFASKKCVFVNVKCFKLKYKGILTSTQAIFETKMCANLKGVGAPFYTDLRYLLRHYLATLDPTSTFSCGQSSHTHICFFARDSAVLLAS